MSRPIDEKPWHAEAIALMVRSGVSLKGAATQLGVPVTNEECAILLRRVWFQKLLWMERHRFHSELGSNPQFTQEVAIGRMLNLAEKLEQEGSHDRAAEVMYKISRIKGWIGPESQVSVFGSLSQRDLDALREAVEKKNLPVRAN